MLQSSLYNVALNSNNMAHLLHINLLSTPLAHALGSESDPFASDYWSNFDPELKYFTRHEGFFNFKCTCEEFNATFNCSASNAVTVMLV